MIELVELGEQLDAVEPLLRAANSENRDRIVEELIQQLDNAGDVFDRTMVYLKDTRQKQQALISSTRQAIKSVEANLQSYVQALDEFLDVLEAELTGPNQSAKEASEAIIVEAELAIRNSGIALASIKNKVRAFEGAMNFRGRRAAARNGKAAERALASLENDVLAPANAGISLIEKSLEDLRACLDGVSEQIKSSMEDLLNEQVTEQADRILDEIGAEARDFLTESLVPTIEELRTSVEEQVDEVLEDLFAKLDGTDDESQALEAVREPIEPLLDPLVDSVGQLAAF